MKKFTLLVIGYYSVFAAIAQNIFPVTGNVGIGTTTPEMLLDVRNGNSRFGGSKNHTAIDSSGNLTFNGKATYKVNANRYVFQYSGNKNYGLFFNADSIRYEFRNGNASPAFYVKADNNDAAFFGRVYLDSEVYLHAKRFISGDGTNNTWIGTSSGLNNTGIDNTTLGYNAAYTNTFGYSNTAMGSNAMFSNTEGRAATAIGAYALYSNTTAEANTAVGAYALHNNLTGDGNTGVGVNALYLNTTGFHNTSIGINSLYNNQSGAFLSVLGHEVMYFNTTGEYCTAVGYHALYKNTSGSYNAAIGIRSLKSNTTGTGNTGLGAYTDVASGDYTNATAIGYNTTVNASNKVSIGNTEVTVIGGQVGWSTFSDGRFKSHVKQNVPGLAFINKLKPVTYTFEAKKFNLFLDNTDSAEGPKNSHNATEKIIRTGFIAQDVEKAAKELNYNFDGVNIPENEKDNYSLVYEKFIPSLVKAVQELSEENAQLKKDISDMKAMLQKITGTVTSIDQNRK